MLRCLLKISHFIMVNKGKCVINVSDMMHLHYKCTFKLKYEFLVPQTIKSDHSFSRYELKQDEFYNFSKIEIGYI